ncbi:MAG: hypothetical protein FJX75_12435 [Armatimonadetes bacterium]|nr:hypothetical protein [Armatimonadota bacterium]
MRPLRASLIAVTALAPLLGPGWASDLSEIVQKGNHLIALNELQVSPDQLDKIAPLCDKLVQAVQARNEERQKLLADAAPTLAAARKALAAGVPLTAAAQTALGSLEASLKAADDRLEETAVDILGDIEKEFLPQQSRYIDWTPPLRTTRESAKTREEQAQREREQTALILATVQQLERIRTYPLERYVLEAQKVVDDFLRPLIDPLSPDYAAAQEFMFKLVEEVRTMPEPLWEQRREQMAELLVGELGLLNQPDDETARPKPYNWQTMYAIFSDLGAPDLLKAMKRARAKTIEP